MNSWIKVRNQKKKESACPLKPGTMKVLDGIFFQYKTVSLTLKTCWNSPCGTTWLVAFWEHWDTGLIPCQTQGVRIQHCHSCGSGCNCGSDLISGLGAPYASGRPKKIKFSAHPCLQAVATNHTASWANPLLLFEKGKLWSVCWCRRPLGYPQFNPGALEALPLSGAEAGQGHCPQRNARNPLDPQRIWINRPPWWTRKPAAESSI